MLRRWHVEKKLSAPASSTMTYHPDCVHSRHLRCNASATNILHDKPDLASVRTRLESCVTLLSTYLPAFSLHRSCVRPSNSCGTAVIEYATVSTCSCISNQDLHMYMGYLVSRRMSSSVCQLFSLRVCMSKQDLQMYMNYSVATRKSD